MEIQMAIPKDSSMEETKVFQMEIPKD